MLFGKKEGSPNKPLKHKLMQKAKPKKEVKSNLLVTIINMLIKNKDTKENEQLWQKLLNLIIKLVLKNKNKDSEDDKDKKDESEESRTVRHAHKMVKKILEENKDNIEIEKKTDFLNDLRAKIMNKISKHK